MSKPDQSHPSKPDAGPAGAPPPAHGGAPGSPGGGPRQAVLGGGLGLPERFGRALRKSAKRRIFIQSLILVSDVAATISMALLATRLAGASLGAHTRAGPLSALAVAGLVVYLVASRLGRPMAALWRRSQTIAHLGRLAPRLASRLKTADELCRYTLLRTNEDRLGASPALAAAHVAALTTELERADLPTVPKQARLLAPLLLGIACLGGLMGWRKLSPDSYDRAAQVFGKRAPLYAETSASTLVDDIELTLHPPRYTGLPVTTLPGSSGDAEVLEGTTVDIEARLAAAARSAYLLLTSPGEAGDTERMIPFVIEGEGPGHAGRARARIAVERTVSYSVVIENRAGRLLRDPVSRMLSARPDAPPTVALRVWLPQRASDDKPGPLSLAAGDIDVETAPAIELRYEADDDVALHELALVYELAPGRPSKEVLWLAPGASAGGKSERTRSYSGTYRFEVAELGLAVGERVPFEIVATDGRPNPGAKSLKSEGRSERFFLHRGERRSKEAMRTLLEETTNALASVLSDRLVALDRRKLDLDAVPRIHNAEQDLALLLGRLSALALEFDEKGLGRSLHDLIAQVRAFLDAERRFVSKVSQTQKRRHRTTKNAPGADDDRDAMRIPAGLEAHSRRHLADLEDGLLRLDDWMGRLHLDGLALDSKQVAAAEERLERAFAEYKRRPTPERARAVLAELAKLRRLLGHLQQKVAQISASRDVSDEYLNRTMEDSGVDGALAKFEEMLKKGDVSAAAQALGSAREGLAELDRAIAGSGLDLGARRFAEAGTLRALRATAQALEARQRGLAQEAMPLAKDSRLSRRNATAAAEKQSPTPLISQLEAALSDLARIPKNELEAELRRSIDTGEWATRDAQRLLRTEDLFGALERVKQSRHALEDAEEMVSERSAPLAQGPLGEQAIGQSSIALAEALPRVRKVEEALSAALTRAREGDSGGLSANDQNDPAVRQALDKLEKLGKRQRELEQAAAGILRAGTGKGAHGKKGQTNPQLAPIFRRLGQARSLMQEAASSMGKGDAVTSSEKAQQAADELGALKSDLDGLAELARPNGSQPSTGADAPIAIPPAEAFRPGRTFRQDILEAMKHLDRVPSGYSAPVRRYYEELIR